MDTRNRLLRAYRMGQRWVLRGSDDPYLAPDPRTVPIAGHAVPRHFTGGYQLEGGGSVELTVRMVAGSPVVERFEVIGAVRREGPTATRTFAPVTPEQIRKAAAALKHELPLVLAEWAPFVLGEWGGLEKDEKVKKLIRRDVDGKVARRKLTPDHLQEVARIYRSAPSLPRQAVIDWFDTNENTANRWISAARRAGLLGEAPAPGVGGEVER